MMNSADFTQDLVFTRPEYVGQLYHTLFTANLENAATIKRLRRLMGYK